MTGDVFPGQLHGRSGCVKAGHGKGSPGQGGNGESAGVAKRVHHRPAAGQAPDRLAVFPLVKIKARFLGGGKMNVKAEVLLPNFDRFDRRAVEQALKRGQSLLFPRRKVRFFEDRFGPDIFPQMIQDRRLEAFDPQGRNLKDENGPVPVDDQAGDPVAFGVDQPAGVGRIAKHLSPEGDRPPDVVRQGRLRRGFVEGQHPADDRRAPVEIAVSEKAAFRVPDGEQAPVFEVRQPIDGPGENPMMAVSDRLVLSGPQNNSLQSSTRASVSEKGDKGTVGRSEDKPVEFGRLDPPGFGMLPQNHIRPRTKLGQKGDQLDILGWVSVKRRPQAIADGHLQAQLFSDLAPEAVFGSFPRFGFSAGKFPESAMLLPVPPPADQDPPRVSNHRGRHFLHRPAILTIRPGFGKKVEMGVS